MTNSQSLNTSGIFVSVKADCVRWTRACKYSSKYVNEKEGIVGISVPDIANLSRDYIEKVLKKNTGKEIASVWRGTLKGKAWATP